MELAEEQEQKFIAVVAIDFGTSFSGFAFSFNHHDGGIHMNKSWENDGGHSTFKTPTCLLLNPDMAFHKFGYDARQKYAELEEKNMQKSFYYFDKFKMALHGNKSLNRETTIKAKNGKTFPAKQVFAMSIEYLRDQVLEALKQHTSANYSAKDIKWVITVPAIWKAPAKQFMREAAETARIVTKENPDQLTIALEPEAAAIYCRQRKLREFVAGKGPALVKEVIAKKETRYLICDIGGGTLDMAAHEIIENENIKEIHHPTGGDFGGTKVDDEFEKLMEAFFGRCIMDELRDTYPSDWLEVMTDWETKKRSKRVVTGEETRVRMSQNFITLYNSHKAETEKCKRPGLREFFKKRPVPYDLKEVSLAKGYICLSASVMKQLFEKTISSIIDKMKKVLKKRDLANKINFIFLVGGFADCQLLQERVREEFSMYQVLIPVEANLAVAKGAVMFGRAPGIVAERALPETYGTRTCMAFEECDPKEKCIVVEGVRKCTGRFSLLATVDEVIKVGECRTSTFYPLRQDQTQTTFEFFTTERPDIPRYTDEEGVKKLQGHVTIDCPLSPEKKDRELELKMYFGGTEIKVIVTGLKSGKHAAAHIDFLAKQE